MAEYKTPGVYIEEVPNLPPSVVGVATTIACFVGYTEQAVELDGTTLHCVPRRIQSLAEFVRLFGAGRSPRFRLASAAIPPGDVNWGPAPFANGGLSLVEAAGTRFNLYDSVRLFYANGGGACFIVSCGGYDAGIRAGDLQAGLATTPALAGPAMLAIPDAVLLPDADRAALAVAMLAACQQTGDRMALIDVADGDPDPRHDWAPAIARFRAGLAPAPAGSLCYGAAYFPPLRTSIVPLGEVGIDNFSSAPADLDILRGALRQEAALYGLALDAQIDTIEDPASFAAILAALPAMARLCAAITTARGVLPPSGAMAGVWATNDGSRDVWNAPANVPIAALTAPALPISDTQQADLNVTPSGLSINAIRNFAGRGTLVWGARTLDGNNSDWRYIPVRRATIYVEQSVRQALQSMVFQPNDARTWVLVSAMIENFLHGMWAAGGLVGTRPSDAYSVQCGLGTTMTAQDVLEGVLRVQLLLALTRPAEFIVLTIEQQMTSS